MAAFSSGGIESGLSHLVLNEVSNNQTNRPDSRTIRPRTRKTKISHQKTTLRYHAPPRSRVMLSVRQLKVRMSVIFSGGGGGVSRLTVTQTTVQKSQSAIACMAKGSSQ